MANTKISALTSGSPAQPGDAVPIARAGANFKVDPTNLTVVTAGDGSNTAPAYSFSAQSTIGLYRSAFNRIGYARGAAERFAVDLNTNAVILMNAGVYGWGSGSFIDGAQSDTGLSRDAAGVVDVGNGTQGDKSGQVNLSKIQVNGTLMSNVPVLVWSTYLATALGTSGGANKWSIIIPASGVTITRIIVTFTTNSLAGYSTAPRVQLTDGTTPIGVNLSAAGFIDSGVLSQNYAAGATLEIDTVNGVGGTGTASGMTVSVQYRMQ